MEASEFIVDGVILASAQLAHDEEGIRRIGDRGGKAGNTFRIVLFVGFNNSHGSHILRFRYMINDRCWACFGSGNELWRFMRWGSKKFVGGQFRGGSGPEWVFLFGER